MISDKSTFLSLVRMGIGHRAEALPSVVDWNGLKDFVVKQGLSAVVLDGIDEVRSKRADVRSDWFPSQLFSLEWIGEVLQDYEGRYDVYEKAISSLAGFYNAHGFKMMVLKGYACSFNWPKPNHRPCGDIDIWLFGQQREADAALESSEFSVESLKSVDSVRRIKVDNSHHHHTVFEWEGFTVENHYDFVNVHHHKSNAEFEKIFKELGMDDSCYVDVLGERVYLPSPNLHALFLLKHMMSHFAAEGLNLRQVLDWAFFVEKQGKDVDWRYVMEVLDRFGMRMMFNIINAICVMDLGFDANLFPEVQFDPILKDRVLEEILEPQFSSSVPKNICSRVVYKFRRWKANEWKHKLCYKESMMSAFWSGVWNHLLKPGSI